MRQAGAMLPALVLAALDEGAAHGYRIARRVEARSGGRLSPSEGALYPILHALERQGLVEAAWEGEGERRRRVYQLTPGGWQALEREREAWRAYAAAVERVLFHGGEAHVPA